MWFPDEINDGYLEYYFFLLSALMFIDFAIFVVIAKRYKYVKQTSGDETAPGKGRGARSDSEKAPLLESEVL